MNRSFRAQPFVLGLAAVLAGCGGGGGGSQPPQPTPPAVNAPPVANAGSDQVVNPGTTVNLNGASSTDSNGTIAAYAWTQTGGSAVTLASTATATPSFTAPAAAGALTFQLTVTDNGGASHSDSVTVTVNAIPVANAGADQTVSAGAAVSLAGTGTDSDGSIANYSWTQTSGPAVTLSNATSATASFTAPAAAATLAFNLTATDDRGATQTDSVTVTVTAIVVTPPPVSAPVIARQPNNAHALEHGSAMMFVAVSGQNLNYEWRRASGAVMKSGPEPFMLRDHLSMGDNGDCYFVVVSNTAGIVTSQQGCLTVENIDWHLDPSDDPDNGDDRSYALGFGSTLMKIAQTVTGPFTGLVAGQRRLGFPIEFGAPENCFMGSYGGTTLDGVMLTSSATPLPLGHHWLSEAWNDCLTDVDDTSRQTGAYLVEYDFPQTWGIGTLTIHVSDRYFNGTIRATLADDAANHADDIEITIAENFSSGDMRNNNEHSIFVDRRFTTNNMGVDDVYVDFNVLMSVFDDDGGAGTIGVRQGSFFHLHQNFPTGDDPAPIYTSSGQMVVGLSGYVLATLEPSGSPTGWGFHLLPEPECPVGQICVDPPGLP